MNINESNIDQVAIELQNKIELGDECDDFIRSRLGQYCILKASQEIVELREELENLDTPLEKIRDLQNKIWARQAALRWFFEAVIEGKTSLDLLEEYNAED